VYTSVMHVMIYVYVVPYCFLLWFILRRDADHLRRRKLRNQRIKARQAEKPLLDDHYSIQHIHLRDEDEDDEDDDIEVKAPHRFAGDTAGSAGGGGSKRHRHRSEEDDTSSSITEVSEYDPGSYLFPSARVVRYGGKASPQGPPPFLEDYDQQLQNESAKAARGAGSVDKSSGDREREAAVALNQSLRQILRERTVPIRLMESRSVRFLRKIGVGGYGEVYLAEWEGIEVAVKRFVSERPEKNFLKEIEVISRLDHPNILAFIGAIVEPSSQCLITVPCGAVCVCVCARVCVCV
jgi:hypothetical protein